MEDMVDARHEIQKKTMASDIENQQNLSSSLVIHYGEDADLVRPSIPTPEEVLSLSTIDNDPYIETLCKTIYAYRGNDHASAVRRDPTSVLKQALSKVLVYYYPLAGKLRRDNSQDGKLRLTCTCQSGVPFVEATAECALASVGYLDAIDAQTAHKLVPPYDADLKDDSGYHPLAIQVTRFSCGGFTVGLALSHSVCDGFGAAQFFRALAELAAEKTEPTVKPIWERHRLACQSDYQRPPKLLPISDMARVATSPFTPSDDNVRGVVDVKPKSINRLKTTVMKDLSSENDDFQKEGLTTLEVLAAYVWRARFRALKLNPDGITLFGVAVGIRTVFDPPLPAGYYGNAFVKAHLALTGRELDESPLSHTVKLIRRIKKSAAQKNHLRDQISDTEKMLKMKTEFKGGDGAFMLLTDWRQLGLLEEVDFGWGETVNIIPLTPLEIVDLCIFLPPSKLDPSMVGGVRVLVTLPRAAMAGFREEMAALDTLGDNQAARE